MSHVITAKIYDLGTTELADITEIALEKTLTRQLNGPRGFVIKAPAGDTLLTTIAGDGFPNLHTGNRKLVVWEDGNPATDDPIFHGRIFMVERDGDENAVLVTITAYDPWMELGFEADNRAGRPVRDNTRTLVGDPSFLTPSFESSVGGQDGISGPDLIRQILTYSQSDPTTNPIQGEGPLPIDLVSGTWDLDVPPALDISPIFDAVWPALCGDFIAQLIATNVVDFDLRPVAPGSGKNLDGDPDPLIMVEASARSKMGTDLSATVHFDYLTGAKNAIGCKHVEDFSTYADRLWYELGPRLTPQHWRGDITPHTPSVSAELALMDDAAAIYGGPDTPGRFASFRVLDSLGTENSSRPLYVALYKDEVALRVNPRSLLYITPSPDSAAVFVALRDFDAFDVVQIKTGPDFGIELDDAQRVYGFTKTWSAEGVASVSQLVTSSDADSGGGGGGGGGGPTPLTARFSMSAPSGPDLLTVDFTDLSIAGPSGAITGYEWDFGDSSGTSASASPTYTYAAAGTYPVVLTVTGTDPDGTDSITLYVTVGGLPSGDYATAVAALTYNPRAGAGADEFAALDAAGVVAAGGRHVVCTSRAEHDTAVADIRAGDWIDCQGIHFTGQVTYHFSLTDWAKITYDAACVISGVTSQQNAPSIYIRSVKYGIFLIDTDVTAKLGGSGILCHAADHLVVDVLPGSSAHDCGKDGFSWLPAVGDIQNFFLRGGVHNVAQHLAYDPHSEKGTGLHCCICADAAHGVLHHGLIAVYGHDCVGGGGSVIEIGENSGSASLKPHDIDIYLKGSRMLFEALHQTAGNGLNAWGVEGANIVVHVVEVDDMMGHGVNSDDGATGGGTRKSGVSVLSGTATDVCQNPRFSGDNPWQEGGGITYGTMTPAAP